MKITNKRGKIEAISLIVNLLVAVIAFSFLVSLSNVSLVSGRVAYPPGQWGISSESLSSSAFTGVVTGGAATHPTSTPVAEKTGLDASEFTVENILGGSKELDDLRNLGGDFIHVEDSAFQNSYFATNNGEVWVESGERFYPLKDTTSEQIQQMYSETAELDPNLKSKIESQINAIKETKPEAGSLLSEQILKEKAPVGSFWGVGGAVDAILSGAQWAVTAYLAGQLIGSLFGLEDGEVNAVSGALSAGFGFGKFLAVGGQKEGFLVGKVAKSLGIVEEGALASWVPWIGGLVIGLIVLELLWENESKELVTFECYPWEAPEGGSDCEKCNSGLYPCTEYRCKSLGQACELLNEGTGEEKCSWINPRDVKSPIISTWTDALTLEHIYKPDTAIRPPDRGVEILYQKSSDGCVKAFSPLEFGITVNEPAQCKVDYTRTEKYEEMQYFFGGSNIYKYNHTQTLRLPGPDSINAEAPELQADGEYNLYVRCQDANGNANDDLFVFSFCVEKGPDVTSPVIEGTSIANNMPFQYGLNQTEIEVYVNEPSECRWSKSDIKYDFMGHNMVCSEHIWEMNNQMLYVCKTTLTDLEDRKDNIFYFRCKDQPYGVEEDRNVNTQSYDFVLKGTQPLDIVDIEPESGERITGYSTLATVYLELKTENGYNFGDSWCSYSISGEADSWIEMYETGTDTHKQRLDLPEGEYIYYFQCVDLGGNSDSAQTEFNIEIDEEPPVIVRAYQDSNKLKIMTDEDSVCSYSTNEERECSFDIDEGTSMPYADSEEHYAEWLDGKTYYIKCKDSNERQPLPDSCSIIVKASEI